MGSSGDRRESWASRVSFTAPTQPAVFRIKVSQSRRSTATPAAFAIDSISSTSRARSCSVKSRVRPCVHAAERPAGNSPRLERTNMHDSFEWRTSVDSSSCKTLARVWASSMNIATDTCSRSVVTQSSIEERLLRGIGRRCFCDGVFTARAAMMISYRDVLSSSSSRAEIHTVTIPRSRRRSCHSRRRVVLPNHIGADATTVEGWCGPIQSDSRGRRT